MSPFLPPGARDLLVSLLLTVSFGVPSVAQEAPRPPELPTALSRIDTLRTQGDFRAALARADRLQRRHPDEIAILWRRALLLSDIGRRLDDPDRTIAYHRRALLSDLE